MTNQIGEALEKACEEPYAGLFVRMASDTKVSTTLTLRGIGIYVALRKSTARSQRTIARLSEKFGISPPSVSKIVDGLEKLGIVRREPDTVDKRKVFIEIVAPSKPDAGQ